MKSKKMTWNTKKNLKKLRGLNWARREDNNVWYDGEECKVMLSMQPIDEEPPEFVLETSDGDQLRVNLLNKNLSWFEPGSKAPKISEEFNLIGPEHVDVTSKSELSQRMQNHLDSLSATVKRRVAHAANSSYNIYSSTAPGSTVPVLLKQIEAEEKRQREILAEINIYKQFFGDKIFKTVEQEAFEELEKLPNLENLEIKIKSEDEEESSSFEKVGRKRKRKGKPVVGKKKKKIKEEPMELLDPKDQVLKYLDAPRKRGKKLQLYLTFNCLTCHGIFTSAVNRKDETVKHLCSGLKNVTQGVRPRTKNARLPIRPLEVVEIKN